MYEQMHHLYFYIFWYAFYNTDEDHVINLYAIDLYRF